LSNAQGELLSPINSGSNGAIEELFDLLQTEDLDSFNEVFLPIRGRIIRLAQQRLQREEVEDVVQQTLSTFWEKRQSVCSPEHLLPFLFQILRNKLGDAYRRKKRQKKARFAMFERLDSLQTQIPPNPEKLLEEKELEKIIKEAIEFCAAENMLWGRIIQLLQEGRSREEIRKELGDIPMATVYTRIHRARQHLIKILKEEFGVEI